jgi:predicted DCC family thiol-disulfide oxidoreductase YuxK
MNGMETSGHPVMLFDGTCNLCSGSVQFFIKRDPEARLRFASLQSVVGERFLDELGIDRGVLDSVIVVEEGRWFKESDAVLRLAQIIGGPWRALGVFRLIPRPLRDRLYRLVARNRYRWFGRKEVCWLPTPELQKRFLS